MKLFDSKKTWIVMTFTLFLGYWVSCKNETIEPKPVGPSDNELIAELTTTPPNIDGNIAAIWDKATKLTNVAEVPVPGNNLFAGYHGDKYTFSLRCLYDAQNIYFLAEWNDSSKVTSVQPWYFNPVTKRWAQEANSKQYDVNGVLLRDGMGTDQLAFLWNIDNSTRNFATQTCYASCHIFTPYRNFQGVMVPNKSGNHYTNGLAEKIDMWWLRLNKELPRGQMDDQYQDWAGGPAVTDTVGGSGNGRHADDLIPPTPFSTNYTNTNPSTSTGPLNNRVALKLDGTGASVNVPAWIIPNASNVDYFDVTDTLPGGNAKKVIGISSIGVITYEGGGTIDPTGKPEYEQKPGVNTGVGAKCFPGFITAPFTGGRADFTVKGMHTGRGWVVEFKRALNTNNTLKQDVNFISLQDQPFGISIFENSNNQHSIKPDLLLKFKK
jgi:Ethylbenzene dehydrogenase